MIPPPRWTREDLEQARVRAVEAFRRQRMQEPLEDYLALFDQYQEVMDHLLKTSGDLIRLESAATEILTDPDLLEAFRNLAGPPVSQDDLRTLSDAVLSPGRLRNDPAMASRVIEVVRLGLDRRRFAWVGEGRVPSAVERAAAVLASSTLLATRKVGTDRRHKGKREQETQVEEAFLNARLIKAPTRRIATFMDAPPAGHFCRESELEGGKADFVLRLWDNRIMAIECKVSNSAINSVKRLNREAAAKGEAWIRDLGAVQMIPAVVLTGVYKIRNLLNAQQRGLTLFWAHALGALVEWIERTRN